jgi:hypothetical protein
LKKKRGRRATKRRKNKVHLRSNAEKTPTIKLKDMIFKLIPCLFPQVIDHTLSKGGYPPNERCTLENLDLTSKAAEDALNFTKRFQSEVHPGYLLINQAKDKEEPTA